MFHGRVRVVKQEARNRRVAGLNVHFIQSTEFQSLYDRLGVTIIERGESFYQPLMPEVIKDLEAKSECWLLS